MTAIPSRTLQGFCVTAILAALIALHAYCIPKLSVTYDEGYHLLYGLKIAQGNSDRFDDSKMPFSVLNAAPLKAARLWGLRLDEPKRETLYYSIRVARFATVVVSLLLALLIWRWAGELYGAAAGMLGLFVYAFEPNLIAHSQLVTTDLYAAFTTTLAVYCFWRFSRHGGWRRAFLCALALGLAQLAKYTAVHLYPLFLLLTVLSPSAGPWTARLRRFAAVAALFAAVSILVINVGFLFNRTLTPLSDYQFKSALFKDIQAHAGPLKALPVPVPYPYLEGLDHVKFNEETGTYFGRAYLLGKLKEGGERFNGYYFFAFFFKAPIAFQILIVLALLSLVRGFNYGQFIRDELFLILPILYFSIYFNYMVGGQMGIRFFLVVFPFLIVLCARLLKDFAVVPRLRKVTVAVMAFYLLGSSASYFPHYLSYFNEIVWDRKMSYKYLADSNIDWGQNLFYAKRYLEANPHTIWNPFNPAVGRVVIDVNYVTGIRGTAGAFDWLKDFKPTDHVAYSYLVYDITPARLSEVLRRLR